MIIAHLLTAPGAHNKYHPSNKVDRQGEKGKSIHSK
jgi:hypothetical protein